jgi:hypothetical protein
MPTEKPGEEPDTADLPARLRHVYWIGGGSGAGKSTVARRLADRHGWGLYATDDVMHEHARRTTREEAPLLHEFMAMDMDERWVNRSPEVMLETFPWFHGEAFGLIVQDLLRLPAKPCTVVEGFRLLPRLVEPLLAAPERAVWLLPTPAFRQAVFDRRSASGEGFVRKTSNPSRAARNLAERDRMFTERVEKEAGRLRLRTVLVETSMTEDDLVEQVSTAFRLRRYGRPAT